VQMLCFVTQHTDFTVAFFSFKNDMVSQYTCKANFIYTHKDSTTFPAQTSAKLTGGQRYTQISHTAFHTNRKISLESTERKYAAT
jgi:hypothetical protein